MDPPLSTKLMMTETTLEAIDLAIHPASIFSTSVGASHKQTLAVWHVQTPADVVASMLSLVNDFEPLSTSTSTDAAPSSHL